jgi:hypothetical protein
MRGWKGTARKSTPAALTKANRRGLIDSPRRLKRNRSKPI